MNPGPVEEVGKAAGSFMDIMKSQPLSLALVIMNFALLGYMFYEGHENVKQREHLGDALVKQQTETSKLLSDCIPVQEMKEILRTLKEHGELPILDKSTSGQGDLK